MICKDCLHYEVCEKKNIKNPKECNETIEDLNNIEKICKYFNEKSKYIELPCIAMIEQHLVGGKFVNNNLQNWNGKYAVVYFDKKKSNAPLIDVCGKSHCNVDEAQERLKELKENA